MADEPKNLVPSQHPLFSGEMIPEPEPLRDVKTGDGDYQQCPFCREFVDLDDCDICGAEPGCQFCNHCGREFAIPGMSENV